MKKPTFSGAALARFLGSMNLAITLLVLLAIASIAGTILKQNQPYSDYEIKFGPFWFDIFRSLGLYDVYSAVWFLIILAFLVISTTICIIRNTPGMLREIRQYRESVRYKSLKLIKNSQSFIAGHDLETIKQVGQKALRAEGFRFRESSREEGQLTLAAMKGSASKWGYWLTHIGIIVICLGGLMDSRLPMMMAEWRGKLKPETRNNLPASQVPPISRIGTNNFSYRGSVDIPEGSRANVIFLPVRDGFIVQELPFTVEVQDFRVEHYSTGQPKSFESDLVIYDRDLPEPLKQTISVNHPLTYKGSTIYQANFGDGGSEIQMRLRPVRPDYDSLEKTGNIFKSYDVINENKNENFRLELRDFRLFNITPVTNKEGEEEQKNIGPNFTFRLRNQGGDAIEYTNYMNPVELDNRLYLISGVRTALDTPQRFLHIPADDKGTAERFFTYLDNLKDSEFLRRVATQTTQQTMASSPLKNEAISQQVIGSMVKLTEIFIQSGFTGIQEDIAARFPEDQHEAVNQAFLKVLRASLEAAYQETLKQLGIEAPDEYDWLFYDDSVNAIANLPFYGSPWYVQMTGFKHLEASGLQITRSPGKNIVYFGSIMLIIGVFLLFYVSHRRIWIHIKTNNENQTEVLIAGTSNRSERDFAQNFKAFVSTMQQVLKVGDK